MLSTTQLPALQQCQSTLVRQAFVFNNAYYDAFLSHHELPSKHRMRAYREVVFYQDMASSAVYLLLDCMASRLNRSASAVRRVIKRYGEVVEFNHAPLLNVSASLLAGAGSGRSKQLVSEEAALIYIQSLLQHRAMRHLPASLARKSAILIQQEAAVEADLVRLLQPHSGSDEDDNTHAEVENSSETSWSDQSLDINDFEAVYTETPNDDERHDALSLTNQ